MSSANPALPVPPAPVAPPAAPPAAAAPSGPPAHSQAYRFRRFLNWFPLGLAYAFLYMGRYNLTVAKNNLGDLMSKEDFGMIFLAGTWVYGVAFLLNGPLTDKMGGRRAMLISVVGAMVANAAMGVFIYSMMTSADPGRVDVRTWMSVLYGVNMYFQSFGAVAIVKVNASWFHVRERGGFSGIFGTMISSGIFLAYTVNAWILLLTKPADPSALTPVWIVFFAPALLLGVIAAVELFLLRDKPSQAGHQDFDVGDGSGHGGDDAAIPVPPFFANLPVIGRFFRWLGTKYPIMALMMGILSNPIILTIAAIEFCTGLVRQGVMQWTPIYINDVFVLQAVHPLVAGGIILDGKIQWLTVATSLATLFAGIGLIVAAVRMPMFAKQKRSLILGGMVLALIPFMGWGWGGILFVAGVVGGNVAGYFSDLFFQSRRAPAAGGLYVLLTITALVMVFSLGEAKNEVGWIDDKKEKVLQPGDQIVSIAGVTEVASWNAVSKAVKCVPAACVAPKRLGDAAPPSFWDASECMCSTKLTANPEGYVPSTGSIPVTVKRGGETLSLELKDPKPKMSAGDTRKLSAGPVLSLSPWILGILGFVASICVIGTHGLLSGTATMDFGGRRGAATAVGVIDGFVYLGSGVQALALGKLITNYGWWAWPMFLVPFSLIGFLFCLPIWNSKPKGRGGH